MNTQDRRGRSRLRRAAPIEPPIVQGENSIHEEDYVENSTANEGRGYENGDDAVNQAMFNTVNSIRFVRSGSRVSHFFYKLILKQIHSKFSTFTSY